jgi:hypothetical protein
MSDEVAVTPVGKDLFLDHYGTRILVKQNGGIVISTRAGGMVHVQSGAEGIRLTASGATVRIGEGGLKEYGVTIAVNADNVLIGADDAENPLVKYNELKTQMDSLVAQIRALQGHMHGLINPLAPGMTTPANGPWLVSSITSTVASETVKVNH